MTSQNAHQAPQTATLADSLLASRVESRDRTPIASMQQAMHENSGSSR
jgi:hypothetical protein